MYFGCGRICPEYFTLVLQLTSQVVLWTFSHHISPHTTPPHTPPYLTSHLTSHLNLQLSSHHKPHPTPPSGTDATHADHIETIKSRSYVGLQDTRFVPGTLGMGLVNGYDDMGFQMSQPHLRAGLEEDLKG